MAGAVYTNFDDVPGFLREYLFYLLNIRGLSKQTVYNYYMDLRLFLRYMKLHKENPKALQDTDFDTVEIQDLTFDFLNRITLLDVHEFLYFTMNSRQNQAKARSRKISALRGFFKYLEKNSNGALKQNPVSDLENPGKGKQLPKFLTLEHSYDLLAHISGKHRLRDYCIITLFLNCGMRLNELVSIDLSDIQGDQLLLHGKGNKERMVYLSDACLAAIQQYQDSKLQEFALPVTKSKPHPGCKPYDKKALFLSSRGNRISNRQVENIVKTALENAGLGDSGYSPHKLRHTAATLMYQHGNVDVRVLQNILGHENLGTTQIYTHVSDPQMEAAMKQNPLANVKPPKNPPKDKKSEE